MTENSLSVNFLKLFCKHISIAFVLNDKSAELLGFVPFKK